MSRPTATELRTFALVLTHGQQGAAERRGVSLHTVHRQLRTLYRRVGVDGTQGAQSAFAAARALGWLAIPDLDAKRRAVPVARGHRPGCLCSVCFIRERDAAAAERSRVA